MVMIGDFTLLDKHDKLRTMMLIQRFMPATPTKTMQGWSVMVAGLGTSFILGDFCAFDHMTTAVRINENDTIMTIIASTRM